MSIYWVLALCQALQLILRELTVYWGRKRYRCPRPIRWSGTKAHIWWIANLVRGWAVRCKEASLWRGCCLLWVENEAALRVGGESVQGHNMYNGMETGQSGWLRSNKHFTGWRTPNTTVCQGNRPSTYAQTPVLVVVSAPCTTPCFEFLFMLFTWSNILPLPKFCPKLLNQLSRMKLKHRQKPSKELQYFYWRY